MDNFGYVADSDDSDDEGLEVPDKGSIFLNPYRYSHIKSLSQWRKFVFDICFFIYSMILNKYFSSLLVWTPFTHFSGKLWPLHTSRAPTQISVTSYGVLHRSQWQVMGPYTDLSDKLWGPYTKLSDKLWGPYTNFSDNRHEDFEVKVKNEGEN